MTFPSEKKKNQIPTKASFKYKDEKNRSKDGTVSLINTFASGETYIYIYNQPY